MTTTAPEEKDPWEPTLGERFAALPAWIKFIGATVVTAVVFVLLVAFWHWCLHLFFHTTGAENGGAGSTWYGFWSGFGGAVPDFLILGGLVTLYRHHNCHVKGCPRIGKSVEGTPYKACHLHHPAHQGAKRNVSLDVITEHYHHARAERLAPPEPPAPAKKGGKS
jgi:hypothetical protein